MKKINYFLFSVFALCLTITNASARTITCNYRSAADEYRASIIVETEAGKITSVTADNLYYADDSVLGGSIDGWDNASGCYKYVGFSKKLLGGYLLEPTNDINDMKNTDNAPIFLKLETDETSELPLYTYVYLVPVSTASLPFNRYNSKVDDDLYFKFYTYAKKKEFCVLVNGNFECGDIVDNMAPTIHISGKNKDYDFTIDSRVMDELFIENKEDIAIDFDYGDGKDTISESLVKSSFPIYGLLYDKLTPELLRLDVSSSPYRVTLWKYLGTNDTAGGRYSPSEICGENGENCDVSLSSFCTKPKVARILKGVGILIVIAKILVPAIIILMGFFNLFKIITAGKEDEARKYAKSIITKVIIGVIIFLMPGLINFVFDIANNIIASNNDYQSEFTNCEKCILNISECNTNGN